MKGNVRIFISILALVFTFLTLVTSSFAWLLSLKRSGTIVFVTGEVKYVMEGSLETYERIVPNTPLVETPFVLTNYSSIDTEIRAQICYQFTNSDTPDENNWTVLDNRTDATIKATLDEKWFYDSGCWYYGTINDGSFECDVIGALENAQVNFISALWANGETCGNEEATDNVIIKIIFQAKQDLYAEWSDLGYIIEII